MLELGRILQRLRLTEGTEMLVKVVLDFLKATFDHCPLIWLGLYDRRSHKITGKGGVLPSSDRQPLRHSFGLMPGDTLEQVVIQQKPIHIPNLQREAKAGDWSRAARQAGIQSAFVLPITCRQQCFGLVLLGAESSGFALNALEKAQLGIVLGEFANVLYLDELEDRRVNAKRPHVALLTIAKQLQTVGQREEMLTQVLGEVHGFLRPTRTSLYWVDVQAATFRCLQSEGNPVRVVDNEPIEIPIAEFAGFHDTLLENRTVAIGESYSSLKSIDTGRLMYHVKARSFLAAPIWHHDGEQPHLLGFLSAEGRSARIWSQDEQQFLHGVARNLALTLSRLDFQTRSQHLTRQHQAAVEIAQVGRSGLVRGWETFADVLSQHLQTPYMAILQLNYTHNQFEVVFQRSSRQALPTQFPPLALMDGQLLERSQQPICIVNLGLSDASQLDLNRPTPELDMRLSGWQPVLLDAGWKTAALWNLHPGAPPESLLVVGDVKPRSWSAADQFLLQWAGQQVATQLDQQALQANQQQAQNTLTNLAAGLQALKQTTSTDLAERNLLQQVQQLLNGDFTALLRIPLGSAQARVVFSIDAQGNRPLTTGTTINLRQDPFLREVLSTGSFYGPTHYANLPPTTQAWFDRPPTGQLYALALRPEPSALPSAIFLAANGGKRWDDRLLAPVQILLDALIQGDRLNQLLRQLYEKRHTLEPLNWYKQRRLEAAYWIITNAGNQIDQLQNWLAAGEFSEASREQIRCQQTLKQLGDLLHSLNTTIKQEQWQLSFASAPLSLVTLLKRVLDRADALLKKRQLWLQVHREGNLTIQADAHKLELIFYELLVWSCQRSPIGGRVDIWYRPVALDEHSRPNLLELTITDAGVFDPQLLAIFQNCLVHQASYSFESLTVPELDRPPGMHLAVYHRIMTAMGGHLYLEMLEDGRAATRLLVPLSQEAPPISR